MEDTELGNKSLSRREFLAGSVAVLAGAASLPRVAAAPQPLAQAQAPLLRPTHLF
jgi:secreted PhoX family phosphatase